jgi:transcriptional antiterminator RfaH
MLEFLEGGGNSIPAFRSIGTGVCRSEPIEMIESSTLSEQILNWVALRTSARWEKNIADALCRCSIPVYLPLLTKFQTYRSRRRAADVPLFPGYVFCSEKDFCGNRSVPQQVRNRVAQVSRPADYELLRHELLVVSNLLASRQLLQERVYGKPGDTVQVIGVPFAGEYGVVCQSKPNKRIVVLEISFLGVRVEVDLEEHLIQKV